MQHPILAANSWESLVAFIIFIALSALSNWIKRKQAGGDVTTWEEGPEGFPTKEPPRMERSEQPRSHLPPKPIEPDSPPKLETDWQRELRKLLGEEQFPQNPDPKANRTPPAPPVPLPSALSGTVLKKQLQSPEILDPVEGPSRGRLTHFVESTKAHQKAQELDLHVLQHMHQADDKTANARPEKPKPLHKEPAIRREILDVLRDRNSLQKAFVLSEVFGTPKGMN